ncbi:acyl-CoA dehydrogenase [Niveibacterium umoris]|uniref:3-methylmercaptopropionyl-CoA dehydrogenase n=1 Tax=Niveibacterium umoris TaxID=1193620 RepID=A0A840BLS2_9RHOO|nr:acyl-CoA dehydrogenase [Niveibacterium umoris]MBB4011437.1 acyl-CoA dehydrogenase [Niveibacterium umoris]
MSQYIAPIRDMQFVLHELAGLGELANLPNCEEATPDVVDAIMEEGGKFASGVLAPLNKVGDQNGAIWNNGTVATAPGWKEAYQQFAESGWTAIGCPQEFGGQGLPKLVSTPVSEMFKSANLAFSLGPMLTQGAIEALVLRGSDALKAKFLDKMVAGTWTGTMNLTEPQAGSDLAAVRSKAIPQADGSYLISGQKIFITYGEHDMTDNIIHLVLARLPDAPEGVKGISLFVVPKFMVNDDGSLGARNDVHCVSIEHKLGIHASPTCVMSYGDKGGAVGYLVGEANRGLEYMFIMMNEARFSVGLEGLAISERAYQKALQYARERTQGTELGIKGGGKVAIIKHPDVRRMLMTMKAHVEAMRALAYVTAAALDHAHHHADDAERAKAQAFADLMIPVVKGWCTETGIEMASLGVQVHGGMGYIEETGAAQYLRDARISAIYEGTTGIQANDLIGRKMAREGGQTVKAVIGMMRRLDGNLAEAEGGMMGEHVAVVRAALAQGVSALEQAVEYILATFGSDIKAAHVGAVPMLKLMGIVCGGWQMARAVIAAQRKLSEGTGDSNFYKTKIVTARFFAEHVLPHAASYSHTVCKGAGSALTLDEAMF